MRDVARLTDHDRAARAPLRIEDERSGEQDRRGRYVIRGPIKYENLKSKKWERVWNVVLKGPYLMAWTGSTDIDF